MVCYLWLLEVPPMGWWDMIRSVCLSDTKEATYDVMTEALRHRKLMGHAVYTCAENYYATIGAHPIY